MYEAGRPRQDPLLLGDQRISVGGIADAGSPLVNQHSTASPGFRLKETAGSQKPREKRRSSIFLSLETPEVNEDLAFSSRG